MSQHKKIVFGVLVFFCLGMYTQKLKDEKRFNEKMLALEQGFQKRGLTLGKNAFEFGCIQKGSDNCANQNPGDDDFNTWMRNNCLDATSDSCRDKALNFVEWLSIKQSNTEEAP